MVLPGERNYMRTLLAVALLTLANGASAQTLVYSSSARSKVVNSIEGRYVLWSTVGVCSAMSGNSTRMSFTTVAAACDWQAKTKMASLAAAANDKTSCFTYSTTLTTPSCSATACGWGSDEGCPGQVCNIKVYRTSRTSEVSFPLFVVQGLNYSVPGNESYVSYKNESSRGSTWSTETTLGNKVSVALDAVLKGLTGEVKYTAKTGTELTAKTSASSSSSFPGYFDISDYMKDEFVLWINPTLTRFTGCGAGDHYVYGAGGGGRSYLPPGLDQTKPIVERFTAAELLNPALATDPWRRSFLEAVAAQDAYESVVKLDPRVSPDGTPNPNPYLDLGTRFRQVDPLGACPTTFSGIRLRAPLDCDVKFSYSKESSSSFTWETDIKVPFFGTVTENLNYSYTSTYKQENSTSNTAVLHLGTTTSGVCISGQIYMDTMFNTYVINSTTSTCPP